MSNTTPQASSHEVFCPFCFQPVARIKLTKKGLPTLHCRYCGTRVFWHSALAVRGYFLMAPKAVNAYRELHGQEPLDLSHYSVLKDTYVQHAERALARGNSPDSESA